jgi:hypothetical protein
MLAVLFLIPEWPLPWLTALNIGGWQKMTLALSVP